MFYVFGGGFMTAAVHCVDFPPLELLGGKANFAYSAPCLDRSTVPPQDMAVAWFGRPEIGGKIALDSFCRSRATARDEIRGAEFNYYCAPA